MVRRRTMQLACGFALLWLSIGAIKQLPLPWLRLNAMQSQPAENTSLQPFFDNVNNPVNVALREGGTRHYAAIASVEFI